MPRTAKIEEPAGKSRPLPDISGTVALSNLPDREETLFAIGRLIDINAEVKKIADARKKLRSQLKLRGHSLDSLDWNVKQKTLDDGTTLQQWRERIRVARFMNLPIGSQVQLFDTPQGNGVSHETLLKHAYDDGYERGVMGKNPDHQAYPEMMPEGQEHMKGWNAGQAVNHEKFIRLSEEMKAAETAKAEKKAAKKAKEPAAPAEAEKPALN